MNATVERVTPSCVDSLARLFEELKANGDERFFHPHPLTRDEASRIGSYSGEDVFAVLLVDGEVCGYGLLRGWDEGYRTPSLGVALSPEMRGRGLALAFMKELHELARSRGASSLRLKVYPENRSAVRLYERVGYRFGDELVEEQLVGTCDLSEV
jgi:ribosomal protein S18 acetylase RimI-like enzyme